VKYHSETHLKNEYTLNKMKDTKAKTGPVWGLILEEEE
jgi:hypothetical protein